MTTNPPVVSGVKEQFDCALLRSVAPGRQFRKPLRLLFDGTDPTIVPH